MINTFLLSRDSYFTSAESKIFVYSQWNAPVILAKGSSEYDRNVIWNSGFKRRNAVEILNYSQFIRKLEEFSSIKKALGSNYHLTSA